MIDFAHGQKMYDLYRGPKIVEPLWLENLDQKLDAFDLEILPRLQKFIHQDILGASSTGSK